MQMHTSEPIARYETIVGERRVALRQVASLLQIASEAERILSKLDAAQVFDELALEDRAIIAAFCKTTTDAINAIESA